MTSKRGRPAEIEILATFFERKQRNNRAFSLRSLAKATGVSPAFLSLAFRGRKNLTKERLDTLIRVLELDDAAAHEVRRRWQERVAQELGLNLIGSQASAPSRTASSALLAFEPTERKFEGLLSPWYYPALMDLTTCEDFRDDPAWMGARLGLDPALAAKTLADLEAAGLLVRKNGTLTKARPKMRFPATVSQDAIRRYHQQMIRKAETVMVTLTQQTEYDRRLITGITIAANPKKFKQARRILEDALHEAAEVLSEGPCTEVYQVNLQVYPHTSGPKNR